MPSIPGLPDRRERVNLIGSQGNPESGPSRPRPMAIANLASRLNNEHRRLMITDLRIALTAGGASGLSDADVLEVVDEIVFAVDNWRVSVGAAGAARRGQRFGA